MRRKLRLSGIHSAFLILLIAGTIPAFSQTFAIITPDATISDTAFADSVRKAMATRVTVLDLTMSGDAFRAVPAEDPFNLSSETAKNIGNSIGCRFYLLVRTGLQRRSSSERHEYFEAFAVYYLVSSLTGSLTRWSLVKFEENTPEKATKKLETSIPETAQALIDAALAADIRERDSEESIAIEDASEAGKDTRPPLPYRRLRPEYTQLADFYNVAATVDIEVDISAEGKILRTAIVRWAGYGLDESVDRTVREMQWRAADRKGVTLPMRVLLRYNFRDLKDEEK